jgi:hypothetical protein
MTPARAYLRALQTDYMVFIERCFATLNPGDAFQDNWHLHAIAEQLRRVDANESTRLIVNVPPRSGKSIMTTIGYSAWRHGRNPRDRIICVSSDQSLVRSLAASYRAIVMSEWFGRAFPGFHIRRGGDRATETITTLRGYRYGVAIGGSVLGRGADLIIADDAMSPMAALSDAVRRRELNLWDTAFRTRLDDKTKGAIIIVCQRLHQDDLVGHVTGAATV